MNIHELENGKPKGEICTAFETANEIWTRLKQLHALLILASNDRGPFSIDELGRLATAEEFLRETVGTLHKVAFELSLVVYPREPDPPKPPPVDPVDYWKGQ